MKKLTQFLFVVVPCAGLLSVQAAEQKEQAGATAEMSEKAKSQLNTLIFLILLPRIRL